MKSIKRTKNLDIIQASRRGKLSVIEQLIKSCNDREIKQVVNLTRETNTPLICAAKYGHLDVIKFLIAHGANIEHRNREGSNALSMAIIHGHLDVVKILITNIECQNPSWEAIALTAAQYGHSEIFKLLVSSELNSFSSEKSPALKILNYFTFQPDAGVYKYFEEAIYHGHPKIIQNTLNSFKENYFESIDLYDLLKRNTLRFAANNGYLKLVKQLISTGMDVNSCEDQFDWLKVPIIYLAAGGRHLETVKYLVSIGAKITHVTSINIFDYIFEPKKILYDNPFEITQYLISVIKSSGEKLDINSYGQSGLTPLMQAIKLNSLETVRCLLENGADPNIAVSSTHISAMHISTSLHQRNLEMIKLLMSFGTNVDQKDHEGRTPILNSALYTTHGDTIFNYLIEVKANPFLHDPRHNSWYLGKGSKLEKYQREYLIWKKEKIINRLRDEIGGYFKIAPLDIIKYCIDYYVVTCEFLMSNKW